MGLSISGSEFEEKIIKGLALESALALINKTDSAKDVLLDSPANASDFEDFKLGAIFEAARSLVLKHDSLDPFSVYELVKSSAPKELVFRVLNPDLADERGRPIVYDLKENLRLLVDNAIRRRAFTSCQTIARKLIYDSRVPFEKIRTELINTAETFQETELADPRAHHHGIEWLKEMAAIREGRSGLVLKTGIPAMDLATGGLRPTLIILSALPGVGKSTLLASLVRNIARENSKIGFFSFEDEPKWLMQRLTSEFSGIPSFVFDTDKLRGDQQTNFERGYAEATEVLKHVYLEPNKLTAKQLAQRAREFVKKYEIKALFVDHLGEILIERSDRHDLDIADVVDELREISKEYKIPVVVACHVKRRDGLDIYDQPKLTDFAFSAAIERKSRLALGLSRAKGDPATVNPGQKKNPDRLRVHILKQTHGISGTHFDLDVNWYSQTVQNSEPSEKLIESVKAAYGR